MTGNGYRYIWIKLNRAMRWTPIPKPTCVDTLLAKVVANPERYLA